MSSQSTGGARFRLRPATFSSPPSSLIPNASRSPSPTISPPSSPHTSSAPGSTLADEVFQYSSRPLVPITVPVPQVNSPSPSSPAPLPALLSTDTNAHASTAFQYSSRPLEPISVPVLAPVKAELEPPTSQSPPSWVGLRDRGLARPCAPPQASPPRLSRRSKGKWRETENSPPPSPCTTEPTPNPARNPHKAYSPHEQASSDNAIQSEGVGNHNGDDKGKLEGEDQAERVDSLPAYPIAPPMPSNQGRLTSSTASIPIPSPPISAHNQSDRENERTASTIAGHTTQEHADAPFAHLPPALRPVRPALVPPPALPTPLPNFNAATRPSNTPRGGNATHQTLTLSKDQQRAQIDALFAKVPRGLRPYRPTALKTPPPLPKGYISLSPSPPRSPTSGTNSNPTPSLSQAPIHGEVGDEAKSSVGRGLLTLVSLTMWPVRNGAKPRTGVATRSQVLKAKGGVLPAAAAQLVIAQEGRDVGKEAGSGHGGTKRKRTASMRVSAAATANKNRKAQRTVKAKLTERTDKDVDDSDANGKRMAHRDIAEALPDVESDRPAKRARLAAPHASAKAPEKAMIRLPPRMTRASARMQEIADPGTSKAGLDENESGVGGDHGVDTIEPARITTSTGPLVVSGKENSGGNMATGADGDNDKGSPATADGTVDLGESISTRVRRNKKSRKSSKL